MLMKYRQNTLSNGGVIRCSRFSLTLHTSERPEFRDQRALHTLLQGFGSDSTHARSTSSMVITQMVGLIRKTIRCPYH